MSMLAGYESFVSIVRQVFLVAAVGVAAVCTFDWAVRTRRINPFNRGALFFRRRIEPLMVPVERAVVRRGGLPQHAPWWTLAAIVVGGIVFISLLQFIGSLLAQVMFGIASPGRLPLLLVSWAFSFLRVALLVRVLSSWLPVSPYSKWIRWSFVTTQWLIAPLQRIVPRLGMFDITPLVAWLLLSLAESVILG